MQPMALMHGLDDTVSDILDIGIVTTCGTITKNRYRLILKNQTAEF